MPTLTRNALLHQIDGEDSRTAIELLLEEIVGVGGAVRGAEKCLTILAPTVRFPNGVSVAWLNEPTADPLYAQGTAAVFGYEFRSGSPYRGPHLQDALDRWFSLLQTSGFGDTAPGWSATWSNRYQIEYEDLPKRIDPLAQWMTDLIRELRDLPRY